MRTGRPGRHPIRPRSRMRWTFRRDVRRIFAACVTSTDTSCVSFVTIHLLASQPRFSVALRGFFPGTLYRLPHSLLQDHAMAELFACELWRNPRLRALAKMLPTARTWLSCTRTVRPGINGSPPDSLRRVNLRWEMPRCWAASRSVSKMGISTVKPVMRWTLPAESSGRWTSRRRRAWLSPANCSHPCGACEPSPSRSQRSMGGQA